MTLTAKEIVISPFIAGVEEANRRERGDFDGLLGQVREDASPLLRDVLTELRWVLLEHYPNKTKARAILMEHEPHDHEPGDGYRNVTPVAPELALAIRLLNLIRSASRCEPDRFLELVLGRAGKRDADLRASARKLRGSRMPQLDNWLTEQISTNPSITSKELWRALPDTQGHGRVFVDGEGVTEVDDNDQLVNAKPLGFSGFNRRATAVRKKLKNAVSK